jgi:HK97 family phage major capsid protein
MPVERIDGCPTVWDRSFRDADFCPDGMRCVLFDGTSTRDGNDTVRYAHWMTHLRAVMERHRGQLDFVRDTSRPILNRSTPVKPRLANRATRRANLRSDRTNKMQTKRKLTERELAERSAQITAAGNARVLGDPREAAHRATKLTDHQARDCALKILDQRNTAEQLGPKGLDAADRAFRSNPEIARRALLTERPAYHSAFQKMCKYADGRGGAKFQASMNDAERQAMLEVYEWQENERRRDRSEFRDQADSPNASGGYAIPVFIDPSIIFTDQPSPNPFLSLCRFVDIDTLTWKGVKSAGSAFAFTNEGAESPESSMTSMSQPTIPTWTARSVIQYSIEIGEDWPNFAAEFAAVLATQYDELLVNKFTGGSGTNEPTGVLTALAAASPVVIVTSATDGTFTDTDLMNTWAALPNRFRQRSAWMADVTVANQIRLNSKLYHASAVGLDATIGSSEIVNGRPFIENDYFPDWSSTTGASTRLVLGDWSQMVIARRAGINIEVVGLLPNVTNNRPDGTRALLAYARIGSDVPNPNGFRYQANT